jgi:hypothetical protein
MFSSTKLEKRADQDLPGSQKGEMAQTIYTHMNK